MVIFASRSLETGSLYALPLDSVQQAQDHLNTLLRCHRSRPFNGRVWQIRTLEGRVLQEVTIGTTTAVVQAQLS